MKRKGKPPADSGHTSQQKKQPRRPDKSEAGPHREEFYAMTASPRTSETLNLAADLIEKHGWTQGPKGWPGHIEHRGTLCLEGGILAALGKSWADPDVTAVLAECPAFQAVSRHLWPIALPWLYNDSYQRTAEEVIATLRAVAVIEAANEDAEQADRAIDEFFQTAREDIALLREMGTA